MAYDSDKSILDVPLSDTASHWELLLEPKAWRYG
eukprot:CAMPEP_0114313610 /NCGR_PEP_ID=MMETSP0059-20121206/21226_1 /TAXON_ID=36894 /ORGANISM="Pyramimonas parkeae, Strain CCMP726" /LENGTH=33 /DNA_ID= /DNA_START= /DNA_END= /DNA_ORIENTATION=